MTVRRSGRGRMGKRGSRRTPEDVRRAATQREMNRQLRVWTPRRILGWSLVAIAVLVGVVHWVAHLGYRPIPLSMGWQDVLIGYPMASVLGVAAAVVLGTTSSRSAR